MENNKIIDRQEKQKEELITCLKKTPIVQAVCQKIGISRATYYRWRKNDQVFSDEIDEALSEGKHLINDMAESQLISAIKDRNLTAIIFWLKNHHKAYANKLELSGQIKTEVEQLDQEQENILRQAIQLSGIQNNEKGENHNE